MSILDIDSAFADLDRYYPGSKRPRREATAPTPRQSQSREWDARPIVKYMNGSPVEFFFPISFAQALGKTTVTIRHWERKSYIPLAPYRLPDTTGADGQVVPGKRLYTRPLIEIAIEEFASRGLLDVPRVEWKHHRDLTIALTERWKAITEQHTA